MVWSKQCKKCGAVRPGEDFTWEPRVSSRLSAQCRGCQYAHTKRPEGIEIRRKANAKYGAKPEVKKAKKIWQSKQVRTGADREYERKRYHSLPKKIRSPEQRARCAEQMAISRKTAAVKLKDAARAAIRKFKRQPCDICGDKKVEAHHSDYAKPLQIRWLCKPHHAGWHRLFLTGGM